LSDAVLHILARDKLFKFLVVVKFAQIADICN